MNQWQGHVVSIVVPSINYFNERLNERSGDRFEAYELFEGASIFDPCVAKKTGYDDAMKLLEKLRNYPALNKEGAGNIVDRLKRGYRAYRENARLVPAEFDYKKDKAAILSWNYKMFLRIDKELSKDSEYRQSCRYCECPRADCHCHNNLRFYWDAAQLLSLVMPSSGAAERVFSILNNHFNKQQTCLLGDSLYLSLFLSYNKRSL